MCSGQGNIAMDLEEVGVDMRSCFHWAQDRDLLENPCESGLINISSIKLNLAKFGPVWNAGASWYDGRNPQFVCVGAYNAPIEAVLSARTLGFGTGVVIVVLVRTRYHGKESWMAAWDMKHTVRSRGTMASFGGQRRRGHCHVNEITVRCHWRTEWQMKKEWVVSASHAGATCADSVGRSSL